MEMEVKPGQEFFEAKKDILALDQDALGVELQRLTENPEDRAEVMDSLRSIAGAPEGSIPDQRRLDAKSMLDILEGVE
ncbi:hypothetical protein HON52_03040 [Candidatus Uhrbacteria bacterium]|nr:hypothetical protein [Candidatus Uhrbacteria bacterium]